MKIFISWSGEQSRQIARALHRWLGAVAQHVEPWVSDEEIQSGTRWNDTLARSLEDTDFGIVCVTRANQSAPWLMFEAGALAKRLEHARVVPLCLDLEPSDITSPLQVFQARRLDQDGIRRLVYELSDLAENPRSRESIDEILSGMWPILETAIAQAMTATTPLGEPQRTSEDMLSELVTRVRKIERDSEERDSTLSEMASLRQHLDVVQQAHSEAIAMAETEHIARRQAERKLAELTARFEEARRAVDRIRHDHGADKVPMRREPGPK
ncbi:toll/interleukin-1 receptor domain-containing protein [Micromonospora sp. NPDC049497]|uniref:toll/interleukin-1 receptor domain-containing protein n=1 Tax=Micromonospora sp. NPDC049497 TaxID=3364273 RepID=UPI00378D30B5